MAQCPADCGEIELLGNPVQCEIQPRYKIPSRFHFYACNTTLPDPLEASALEALFESGAIVTSSQLANFTLNDPTFTDVAMTDCAPPLRVITSREITFQDRVAITATQGSPAISNAYFDYAFWDDKQSKSLSLNYMIEYCDGDVVIALDSNGQPLSANLQIWLNHDTTAPGKKVEFKSGSIVFNGDPMALSNPPAFNRAADGTITLIPA